MLFSRAEVAAFINQNFEAVWESVRPVPVVRIDFGTGTVLTRTLHGNVATYACDAAGQVLDVLPGIYEPRAYLDRLRHFQTLARYAQARPAAARAALLKDYHERLAAAQPAPPLAKRADLTKTVAVENPVEFLVRSGATNTAVTQLQPHAPAAKADPSKRVAIERPVKAVVRQGSVEAEPGAVPPADLADWTLLHEDTRLNETVRRRQVHALLAGAGLVRPEAVSKQIYKEVLHADIDDPYLGLGPALFGTYPFRD